MRSFRRKAPAALVSAVGSVLVVLALVTPSAAAPNGPAGNASSGLSAEDQAAQEAQAPYMALGEAVDAINIELGGERLGDYVAISVHDQTVDVAWVGDVPDALRTLATTAARQGIRLRIRPTKNSIAEMRIHTQELARAGDLDHFALGPDKITVRSPFLAGEHQKATRGGAPSARAQGFFDHAAAAASAHGFTVIYSSEGAEEWHTRAGRHDGAAPFLAGAGYQGGGVGSECTMGFQATINTTKYFITAAHCGGIPQTSQLIYYDDVPARAWTTDQIIGQADYVAELYNNRADKYDLAVVRLNYGNLGQVYADSKLTSPGFNTGPLVVQNVANPIIGAEYCHSGQFTRARCGVIAQGQYTVRCNPPPYAAGCEYTYGVRTIAWTGNLWCAGDSGGPVYYYPNGLTANRATAVGIIAMGGGPTITLPGGRVCDSPNANGVAIGGMSIVTTATTIVPGLQVIYSP